MKKAIKFTVLRDDYGEVKGYQLGEWYLMKIYSWGNSYTWYIFSKPTEYLYEYQKTYGRAGDGAEEGYVFSCKEGKEILIKRYEAKAEAEKEETMSKGKSASAQAAPERFEYKRSPDLKPWSDAEERRTREISEYINGKHRAGGEWDEYYEESFIEDSETMSFYDGFMLKNREVTISKMNFTYTGNYDENDNRVKRGKAVKGSTFYTVSDDGDYISDGELGYKTLADARHAAQLYVDREKQFADYRAKKSFKK